MKSDHMLSWINSIKSLLLVLTALVLTCPDASCQDFNYLSLQKRPSQNITRIYPGDSISIIWNDAYVKGQVTAVSDSLVEVSGIPYLLSEVELILIPRSSWGRQVLETAPPKMVQFGVLLFIYGHLNRLILDGKLIDYGMYNAEVLIPSVLPAVILQGILMSTRFRKFNPQKDRVKSVVFE